MRAIIVIAVLAVFLVAGCVSQDQPEPDVVESSLDCPKGMVNDPYPGSCGQYIDADDNGICDHSE